MEQLRQNKKYLFFTSLVVLVPLFAGLLLWNRLPDRIATHFGSDGPNDWSSKPFAVLALPLLLLLVHLLCVFFTMMDPKHQNISGKMLHLVMWICPVVSLFCGVITYAYALSFPVDVELFCNVLLGLLFVILGNYLPKCRQNYTVGIKLPWTLNDEENWYYTHRLAGWVWVAAGLLILVNSFLNIGGIWGPFVVILAACLIPCIYSFLYYIRHTQKR